MITCVYAIFAAWNQQSLDLERGSTPNEATRLRLPWAAGPLCPIYAWRANLSDYRAQVAKGAQSGSMLYELMVS